MLEHTLTILGLSHLFRPTPAATCSSCWWEFLFGGCLGFGCGLLAGATCAGLLLSPTLREGLRRLLVRALDIPGEPAPGRRSLTHYHFDEPELRER